MPDQVNDNGTAGFAQELDDALATLDTALLQAGRSVAIIRHNLSQFAALDRVVHEMEAAMARAREQLGASWASAGEKAPLRSVRSEAAELFPGLLEPFPVARKVAHRSTQTARSTLQLRRPYPSSASIVRSIGGEPSLSPCARSAIFSNRSAPTWS